MASRSLLTKLRARVVEQNLHHLHLNQRYSSTTALDKAKKVAAEAAVESLDRKKHHIVGIGSGSTVVEVVEAFRRDLPMHRNRWFIPSGWQSEDLIIKAGLQLGNINQFPLIDITFDGADDIDSSLNAIKGGGACHLREKVLAEKSTELVLVADWRKESQVLGGGAWKGGVPIEVAPIASELVLQALEELPGYEKASLRMGGSAKAGPVVTDNGGLIIDAHFDQETMSQPRKLLLRLKILTGVYEVGIFANLATQAFFGLENGEVKHVKL